MFRTSRSRERCSDRSCDWTCLTRSGQWEGIKSRQWYGEQANGRVEKCRMMRDRVQHMIGSVSVSISVLTFLRRSKDEAIDRLHLGRRLCLRPTSRAGL